MSTGREPSEASGSSGSAFLTTRWTRVLAARGDSESARAALGELCAAYYRPVVAFLERTGCGTEDPREVAHEFFARLLGQDGVDGAEPARGRFRSYLLGAVKHHLANRRLRAGRECRGGGAEHQSLDAATDTEVGSVAPEEASNLEALFDREWAMAVVERSLAALELEAATAGSSRQLAELRPWLSLDAAQGTQAAAAARLGMNEGAVKVAIHRLRKRFRDLIRAEIAQTVGDETEAREELAYLLAAM